MVNFFRKVTVTLSRYHINYVFNFLKNKKIILYLYININF